MASRWRPAGCRPRSATWSACTARAGSARSAAWVQLSVRDIGISLVSRGLAAAGDGDAIMAGCPVDCLRTVISGPVLNRLARADGRGVPVAPCGPPATVGDVVRLYRQGRLGEIAGLGARSISRDRGRPGPRRAPP